MGNKLGIYRQTNQEGKSGMDNEDEQNLSHSENENTGIDQVASNESSPSPSDTCWKTPIDTFKSQQILALIDPRSPNQDISRTPIVVADDENQPKRKLNIDRFLKVNQSMNQVDSDAGSEFTTPDTSVIFAFDPRSPTHDFDRTPIGVLQTKESHRNKPSKLVEVKKHLHIQES